MADPGTDWARLQESGVAAQWRKPRVEQQGLQRYLEVLRERFRMIVATVLVTTLAAAAYLQIADKVYEAEADLLVTPISGSDDTPIGLGLIRESNDPTRDVETAARLVTTRDVAERVRGRLGLERSASSLLDSVEATPVAQSNIVAITAEAGSPALARNLANAFGDAVVADRTEQFHEQLDKAIARLRDQVGDLPSDQQASGPGSLTDQLARLESLRAQNDPTIRVETRAAAPASAASPRPVLSLAAGLLGGLVLGVGGAFALHSLDPRLRREDQLRELYRLPILARIPNEKKAATTVRNGKRGWLGRRRHRRALGPAQLSPSTAEAYRTLRAMLAASRIDRGPSRIDRGHGRSVLVTGPSPSEGKTTTAINLAASLALSGSRVILIEADFRRPTVGEALGARPRVGIGKVLLGRAGLEDALVPAQSFGESLKLLLVDRADDWLAEMLSLPAAGALLDEAERLADYVIVDSPPLTEVIDALPLAQQVDDVLLVVRIGASKLPQLARLGDLLAQNGIDPTGFAVVGVGRSDQEGYYLSSRRDRVPDHPPLPSEGTEPVRARRARRARATSSG